jgi:CheY-like chemotaxis protein
MQPSIAEPIPWAAIITSMVGIMVILVGMLKIWFDRRNAATDLALAAANATRTEQQRLEKLVVAPLVAVASVSDQATQILYLGRDANDTAPIINAFQEYGINNRLIVKVTTDGVMEYLTDHPETTLAVVAYITDAVNGQKFLSAIKGNKQTMNIPIIAIDGFTDAEQVKLFEAGVDGFLKHPFAVSALMLILTRLGFSSTFSKTK